ncbi:PARP14 [Branchiostoma lanceolatum]|uniref:Poly [ADP-ribose] polymerase n=1 Tax=Branchiostoma lanceolatum TaxID=7740 RepID=A0A8J9ZLU6_BRALA|nr:PARP14 [Branchiostoma lanceolatum]
MSAPGLWACGNFRPLPDKRTTMDPRSDGKNVYKIGQEEHPGNETDGQQSTGDHPKPGSYPGQTTGVPTAPTFNPYHPYGPMPPAYPHPGYGHPTYPSSHVPQQIPGQQSMNIQEGDSTQHPPQPLPSYETVYPETKAPWKEKQPSGTGSEGHPQPEEASPAAYPKGVSYPHHHHPPQNSYPVPDPRGPHGEIYPHAQPHQGQNQQPAGVTYPTPAFLHPQAPEPPTYPGDMTRSIEKQPSGTDNEGHPEPLEGSSASAVPLKGYSYQNYSPQNPYPVPRRTHGEVLPQAHPQGQNQPPVPYPNVTSPQVPGPRQPPMYPGGMTPSKEIQPSGTDSEDHPQPPEDSPASTAPPAPKGANYPNYPPQTPYTVPSPQGPHGEGHPQTHHQGQNQPPSGFQHPNAAFHSQAPGHQHQPGFGYRPPYGYQYPPGYPYPPMPGYPYMPTPVPQLWPYPHQWTGHEKYPQQYVPATEPTQGGEEPAMPQIGQPEDTLTDKDGSAQEDTSMACPGAQMQDGAVCDHESSTPVTSTAESQLYKEPNEADQPSMSHKSEEEKTADQAEEDKVMAIEVTGLPGDEFQKRRDVLFNYFKNTKRSGGGEISQFNIDSEKERVLITFKDQEAPERVIQRSTHEVAKKKLKVRIVKPRRKLPVDPSRILLKGVADHVDEETLFLYLESMSGGEDEPSEVFYGKEPGTVMVAFAEPISDLDTLLSRCEGNELEERKISAERVHATDCIQVTGIPPKASKDNLYYYFENAKRSGGGALAEVELDKDRGTALVFFDDYKVIERVLRKSHTIQKTAVTVEPFYTCLGATVTEAKTPPQLVPLPITEIVTPSIASFVMNHRQCKKDLEDAMEEANASISWPVEGDQSCVKITPTLTKETQNLVAIAENWAPNAKEVLKSCLSRFDAEEIDDVMQASWPQVCKLLDSGRIKDDDTISVRGTSDRKIIFIGLKDSVAKHYQLIWEGKEKIEEDIKRKQSEVDETVTTLKPGQVELLAMSDFKDKMTSKFPKLQMSFDTNGSKVKFHGLLDEIQQTKVKMYETVQGMISQPVKLSSTLISFLTSTKEPKQHLLGEYKQGSVIAVMTTTTNEVEVCGLTKGDVRKAVSILKKTFQEQCLDVSDQSSSVLGTEEWKTTKTGLEQSAQGLLKISVERGADSGATKILFTGESAFVKDIMDRVDKYLKVKTVYRKQVKAEDGVIRFIKEHHAAHLQLQLEKHQVSVWYEGSEEIPIMFIKGNIDGLQQADPVLQSYIDSVISDQMSIKKPGMSKHFSEEAGRSTLQRVERKCKCVINIQDATNKTPAPDPDTFAKQFMPKVPIMVPNEKAVVNLDGGKKLVVWRNDITKHKTDVIVNAANAKLEHTGGLAKAIVDAGGDIIQNVCNRYIQTNGTLIPGQVVASPPGRIKTCQMILHAVGPIWKGGSSGEEDYLADAVYGSLEEAAKNNYRSIAIPAISSGIYGYPLKNCAETIVATTVEYLEGDPNTSLEVIEFVNIDDKTAEAFIDALVSAFGVDRVEKSGDKLDQATTTPPQGTRSNRRRARGREPRTASPSTATTFTPPPQPRDPVTDVGFRTTEGKAIIAIQANIASQNVDVLVNTTAGNLELNTGAVSKAILQLAGSNLQTLVNKAKQSAGITSLPDGQILVTGSADLPCKQVIHCVLCSWDGGQGNSEKVLRKIVQQCLQQAEKGNYTSIAIPAMGTGGLRFPHDVVAEAMFNEAVEHCRTNPSGSLREIRFIVWEGDPKSIPAFNEVMTKYKALHTDDAPQPTPLSTQDPTPKAEAAPPFSFAGRGHGRRGRRGRGSKTGHGRNNMPKAHINPADTAFETPSLFSEVSTPVRGELQMFIGDLTLNVRRGDLTKETTDCIVNSTNEQLDLTRGAVSNAICKAGGPNIQRECANIAASGGSGMKDGIAVTGSGKLKCQKIIHAAAPDKGADWKNVIINCLQTADSLGLRSTAFPALGTGILQGSAAQTATTMLDALQDFVLQCKPTKLCEVRVTIFQQEMVRTFHEEMRKKVGQPLPKIATKPSGILGSIGRAAAAGWNYFTGGQASNTADQPIPSADNVVVLIIYCDHADNLCEAKNMINKMIDDASKDERIPARFKLTEEQKEHATRIAQRHDCLATFTRSNIRLQGRMVDVMMASQDIKDFQRDIETKTNEEKHLSDKAELLLKTVQWYYIDENGEKQPYDPKVNYKIETAHLANQTGVDFDFKGEKLHIDLKTMKETVVGDFAAGEADVIRYEKEKEGNMKIPETWTGMADDDQFKEVDLQPTTEEYKTVHDEFMKSVATAAPTAGYQAITTAKVLKIQRIQNVTLWHQYIVRKKKMELDNARSSQPVERILYHGSPLDPIPSINHTGFNRSYSGRNVGTCAAYGNGVYFAVTASISGANQYARPDANGYRYMYMARVLSGDICKGQSNIIVPPAKDASKPHITFDSVCDNETTPQIIVIFYDAQAYPEYLITFTK